MTARNALVEEHLYLIDKTVSWAIKTGLRVDDVRGIVGVALVEAADRFDPSIGASFATYAHRRLRGAVVDAIRDWYGRRVRKYHDSLDQLAEDVGFEPVDVRLDLENEVVALLDAQEELACLPWDRLTDHELEALIASTEYGGQIRLASRRGLTDSRICQLVRSAVEKLRAA